MNMKEIKELVEILESSSLGVLEVSEEGRSIRLEKELSTNIKATEVTQVYCEESNGVSLEKEEIVEGTQITSPMVGVFYSKPSPEEEPYVKEGTHVKKGQTLCIIEAMKLMNEITAEKDGVVTKICALDGDLIEFGQKLFYIA